MISPESNFSKKGFAPILIIVIVAVAAALGGWYFLKGQESRITGQGVLRNNTSQATTIDVSAWRTFTNSKYGWSIKYPDNWEVEAFPPATDPSDQPSLSILNSSLCKDGHMRCARVTINAVYGESLDSLKQFLSHVRSQLLAIYILDQIHVLSQQEVVIDNDKAYEITYAVPSFTSDDLLQVQTEIGVDHNGKMFDIAYFEHPFGGVVSRVGDMQLTELFNAILSTFKFVN